MLHVQGKQTAPYHIDKELLKHPHIKEAVICGIDDKSMVTIQGPKPSHRVRAYIIKKEEADLKGDNVTAFAQRSDPSIPVINGGVAPIDKIPKTTVRVEFTLFTSTLRSCIVDFCPALEPQTSKTRSLGFA